MYVYLDKQRALSPDKSIFGIFVPTVQHFTGINSCSNFNPHLLMKETGCSVLFSASVKQAMNHDFIIRIKPSSQQEGEPPLNMRCYKLTLSSSVIKPFRKSLVSELSRT